MMSHLPLRIHDHWELLWHRNPPTQRLDALDARFNEPSRNQFRYNKNCCVLGISLSDLRPKGSHQTTTQLPPHPPHPLTNLSYRNKKIRRRMHEYDLFCLIEYDSEPFSIKVFADETVENLKKSIIKSELNNFHLRDLTLAGGQARQPKDLFK